MAELRRILLQDIQGKILEIGIGTGVNLVHYPENVQVIDSSRTICSDAAARKNNGRRRVGGPSIGTRVTENACLLKKIVLTRW